MRLSLVPLACLVAGSLSAAPAPIATPPAGSATPPATSHVASMELRVACPRGGYVLSAGTPWFEYEVTADGVMVRDELGENHATLDCAVGCEEVTGSASCTRSTAVAEAASADRSPAPIRAVATLAVSCPGGRSFQLAITTGEGAGRCETSLGPEGDVMGGTCADDEGNEASIECALDAGQGGCISSAGTGICSRR